MKKLELKYGLIIGLGTSAYVMVEFLLGFHTTQIEMGQYTGYFAMMIPIIGLYMAIKDKKEMELNDTITLPQALKTALIVNAIATAIITGFWALYFTVINPEFFTYGLEFTRQQVIASGVTPTQLAERMAQFSNAFTLKNQLTFIPIGTFGSGMVVALVISLILKTKNRIQEAIEDDQTAS
jgi:uncharacterized membrane protein YfcA